VSGPLLLGDVDGEGPDERWVFAVGTTGSFFIDREQLEAPGTVLNYDPQDGLELTHADGSGFRIMQESVRAA
jgi:hypothetical protein